MNFSRENFHARNPGFFDLALVFVGGHEFARVHASLRQLLRERCRAIITRRECVLGARVDPLPEICFALVHLKGMVMSRQVETSRRRHGTVFDGIESLASRTSSAALQPRLCFAPIGMTFQLSSSEKSARSLEKFGPMQTPVAGALSGRWCARLLCRP